MTAMNPMTNEQADEIRTRLASPGLSAAELREIAQALLADSNAQYAEADYWRESYRLAKGLSNYEIGAIIAVRDASKSHPRPCRFPHETCICDEDDEPETECERGDCDGIHRHPDGYQDCDGKTI